MGVNGLLVRGSRSKGREMFGQELGECGAFVRKNPIGGWVITEQGMEGNGVFVRRKRSRRSEMLGQIIQGTRLVV